MDNIAAFGCMLFEICKPWVNQILSCANQNQQCVNFFPPYANPYIAAIPKCFAKSCWAAAYFYMLITCRTFLVQSGEVTFWGQKKFTHFITGLTGLPPDAISKYVVCPFMYVLSFTCMNSVCTVIYLNELCMCKYMGLTYYCFQVSLPLWWPHCACSAVSLHTGPAASWSCQQQGETPGHQC